MEHVLSWMIFFPLVGMALILSPVVRDDRTVRWIAVAATALPLALVVPLLAGFRPEQTGFQFVERASWVPFFRAEYFVGVDGVSITMVVLTALLSFLCIFASFGIEKGVKGYFALFLLLETGMMGVFCALKFFLYTLLGSVLLLVTILYLYFAADPHTFDMTRLREVAAAHVPLEVQLLLWAALFIGFAIKIPAFPFHTWLPDAHVEAPTAISVILAGVLLK